MARCCSRGGATVASLYAADERTSGPRRLFPTPCEEPRDRVFVDVIVAFDVVVIVVLDGAIKDQVNDYGLRRGTTP